jgi:hypothetical protein
MLYDDSRSKLIYIIGFIFLCVSFWLLVCSSFFVWVGQWNHAAALMIISGICYWVGKHILTR